MIPRRIKDERGIAAVVAMLVLVVALLLAVAVVAATINESTGARRDVGEKRAFEAAQAGLQQTLYRFNMLINTYGQDPSTLYGYCMGPSGGVESIVLPSAAYNGTACDPYTESLGNGAFYTSWTSTAPSTSGATLTCAGVTISTAAYMGERCITSEGIVCPVSYTSASQLPCPGEVLHRVEERISANLGSSVFINPGITGTNGVDIQNAPTISGTVSTKGVLSIDNNATVTNPEIMGQNAPWPIIQNNNQGQLGTCTGSHTPPWPATCVTQSSQTFQLQSPPFPAANCTGSGTTCPDTSGNWYYQQPDGDALISNAFKPCGQPTAPAGTACLHDFFTGCNTSSASSCGWNPQARTLALPTGVTWQLTGKAYDFCELDLANNATATLQGRSAIYIDAPPPFDNSSTGPACPSGTGHLKMNGGGFSNPSQDTTALQIYIYGTSTLQSPATYAYNDCANPTPPGANATNCVLLSNSSTFYGTVDAPTSDVEIKNNGSTYGSVEGRTVTYANGSTFYQDQKDTDIKTYALGVYYRTEWHDCAVHPTNPSDPTSGC